MLFNSFDFAIFLPTVFVIYWLLYKSVSLQNLFIVLASYVFYGWWDWRFLFLIFFSSSFNYFAGKGIYKYRNNKQRKMFVFILSLIVNIGLLSYFKYFNFFLENFISTAKFIGVPLQEQTFNIVLPLGISFYTFQELSYSIDLFRGKLIPARSPIHFFAYVSFFPLVLAGPIERATHLLPQFSNNRIFDYNNAVDGLRQILWGLFKKSVIADNAAIIVNAIFPDIGGHTGSELFMGAFFFTFQIYCDFSAYSDIAIGAARLLGFDLKRNFAYPYFSRDFGMFWQRWHISLTTWFRDYLYIPLGGNRVKLYKKLRNILIIFIVSGLWHGANWTFIAWGLLNALYYIPRVLLNQNRVNADNVSEVKMIPSLIDFFKICVTFTLSTIAWIFFRARDIGEAVFYLKKMFSLSLFSIPRAGTAPNVKITLGAIFFLVIIEWIQREKQHGLAGIETKFPRFVRWSVYYVLIISMLLYGGGQQQFIYFQF
jgi:D-alanyl-lipoteichoic acid acyltransferase DltB (MBOAT superfamily)